MKNKQPDILTFNPECFIEQSSIIIGELIDELLNENDIINIALSGGTSPLPIYTKLKEFDLSWDRVKFFIVDERCVSQNSEENNFFNISNCFFNFISSDSFPIVKDDMTYELAAANYQDLINQHVPNINGIPQFHLIILGMGLDGHTASLFPETKAIKNNTDLMVLNDVPQLNTIRITMTYPLIINAKKIILLINGEAKKTVFESALKTELPITKIIPFINLVLN